MGREDSTTMKRRRHTPGQVTRKLAHGEKLLGEGKSIEEMVRHLEITRDHRAELGTAGATSTAA